MDPELKDALKEILNRATTPAQIVASFRLEGTELVDLAVATQILEFRATLPHGQFTWQDIVQVSTLQKFREPLARVLKALPTILKWRYNDRPVLMFPLRLETRAVGFHIVLIREGRFFS